MLRGRPPCPKEKRPPTLAYLRRSEACYQLRDGLLAGVGMRLPLALLHLRPHVGQPSTPCAGRRLSSDVGCPPFESGMTWSIDCEPWCPHSQHTSVVASSCARMRRQGRPLRPRLGSVGFSILLLLSCCRWLYACCPTR